MTSHDNENPIDRPRLDRRGVMKAAAAAAGFAMLPSASLFARAIVAPVKPSGLTVSVGYLQTQTSAQSKTSARSLLNGAFTSAATVAAKAALYKLRVLSAHTDQPLSIDAQYAQGAEHHFWQAWTESNLLQHSPPSAIRWQAAGAAGLPLQVWYAGTSTLATINAHPGTYAMMIAAATQTMPDWSAVTMQGGAADGAGSTLVARNSAIAIPYFIFQVHTITA